jgi:hypothetical protein
MVTVLGQLFEAGIHSRSTRPLPPKRRRTCLCARTHPFRSGSRTACPSSQCLSLERRLPGVPMAAAPRRDLGGVVRRADIRPVGGTRRALHDSRGSHEVERPGESGSSPGFQLASRPRT